MSIQDFLNVFSQGGARPNKFRVYGTFPSGTSSLLNKLSQGASIAGAAGSLAGGSAGAAISGIAGAAGTAAAGAGVIASALGAKGGGAGDNMAFQCKAATLPESTIGEVLVKYQGRTIKLPGDRTYPNWTITVLNDSGFSLRDNFMNWHNSINDPSLNTGSVGVALLSNFFVQQLDSFEQPIKTYNLVQCFPNTVGPITVGWDNDNQIETFDVSFSYQFWKETQSTGSGLTGALGSLGIKV